MEHHAHSLLPAEPELRVKALETLLVGKGLVETTALDTIIDYYSNKVGPRNGARVIAKAWTDPGFRSRLLEDATAAVATLGISGRQGEHLVAVENTRRTHNLVVCTLCSCYPWPMLGIPPAWYKSDAYRKRAVREPRAVLSEFGVQIPDNQRIRVWDSTAEIRYIVLPMRPGNTEGLGEEALTGLVTRDSMVGTGLPITPDATS